VTPTCKEEAAKLKLEWDILQMPPNLNYALRTRIETQKDTIRRRMIGFLAAVLEFASGAVRHFRQHVKQKPTAPIAHTTE
jgi:hypothetical protein